MARNVKERALVFVTVAAIPTLKYGFNSGADTGDRGILGQTVINPADPLTGLVIGANNVKPPKATKLKATGSESSFCSHTAITALKAAGWTIARGKLRTKTASRLSLLYYVTINGINYGWSSTRAAKTPDIKSLGLKVPKATDTDIIYGASFPKPGRASFRTDDGHTFSTFYDPSATPGAGWTTSAPTLTLA
jgi:hypothetical protein